MTVSPSLALRPLKSLQNCMMFTPCWPRAGPTGGEGFALPAGSWSLMYPVTFFLLAIVLPLLYMGKVELDGRRSPEDADHDLELLLVWLDLLDRAREVRKRAN